MCWNFESVKYKDTHEQEQDNRRKLGDADFPESL